MKRFLFIIAVLLGSIGMFAQPRSEEQAKQIASEFFKKKPQQKAPMLSVVPQQKVSQTINKKVSRAKNASAQQHSSCYIINDETNNRYVIVSADERMYNILGYSDNGCFDAEKAPEALLELIDGYSRQYSFLMQNGNQVLLEVKPQKVVPIEPMLETKWNQNSPFNNECPFDKDWEQLGLNLRSVTGCAATAMAQIMNYHRYPQHGDGYVSYVSETGLEQEMDLSSVIFDWDNMANEYNSNSDEAQIQAVAQLMHACGVSIRTEYGFLGSGALSIDVAYAFSRHFKYNPNIKYYLRDYYSNAEWNSIILNDLRHGLPIFYGGQTKTYDAEGNVKKDDNDNYITEGHGFVIDGCDESLLYHINYGYSGDYDGYYLLEALTLKENVNFELNQEMICNISPNEIGEKEDMFYATSLLMFESLQSSWFSLQLKKKLGESVIFGYDPLNCCNSSNSYDHPFVGEYGIGLFDLDYNFITYLRKNYVSSISGWYAGSRYSSKTERVYLWSSDFKNGNQYIIAPYAKGSDSERPTIMRTMLLDAYLATVVNDSVSITMYSEPTSIIGNEVEVSSSKTAKMQISLENIYTHYKGFQFDIMLPEGVSIVKGTDGLYAAKLTERCSGEDIEFYLFSLEDNVYSFSVSNIEISPSDGALLDVDIMVSPDVKEGSYTSTLKNAYFVKPNGKMEKIGDCQIGIKVINNSILFGDANNDGAVDVSDIVCIVNYILEKTVEPFNFNNADVNEDGEIDVADITLVVSIIMTSEVKPAQEFFTTNEIIVYESSQGNYTMSLPSINQYAASQFDLIVPSGTSVQEISLNENQLQDHQLTYTKIGDNRYRVIVYSPKNNTFASNTDNLLTIMTSNGNSPIEIENVVFATNLGEKHNFDTTWSQATGINGIIAGKHGRSVFTLDGRSISPYRLSKGIYIINGEKHIVK